MKIIFAEKATEDFVEILEYMSGKNFNVAKKISKQVQYTCSLLVSMPKMGSKVDVFIDSKYFTFQQVIEISNTKKEFKQTRKFPVVDFRKIIIFYQVVDDNLEIIRIVHSSRDIPTIFAEEV